jgi:hypothetical protein
MHDANAPLRVEAKMLGKRKPINPAWYVALPSAFFQETADPEHGPLLRHLIAYIVSEEVRAFQMRQEEHHLLHILQPHELNNAASTGKISMGDALQRSDSAPVDENAAVEIALQGFQDGIYFVFIDGQKQDDLDASVQLSATSTLLFLRLVALIGG